MGVGFFAFAALVQANSGSRKLDAAAAAPSPAVFNKLSSMTRKPSFIPSVEGETDDKLLAF